MDIEREEDSCCCVRKCKGIYISSTVCAIDENEEKVYKIYDIKYLEYFIIKIIRIFGTYLKYHYKINNVNDNAASNKRYTIIVSFEKGICRYKC